MHGGVVLVAGLAQRTEGAQRPAVGGVLRDQRAQLGLTQEDRIGRCTRSRPSPPSTRLPAVMRGTARAGQPEPGDRRSRSQEHLHARFAAGRVGDDERVVVAEVECRRVEQASRLGADRDQLACGVETGGSDEDRVGAPVEDEVVARSRLLAGGHLLEAAGDVGGKRRDRRQRLDLRDRACRTTSPQRRPQARASAAGVPSTGAMVGEGSRRPAWLSGPVSSGRRA